MATKNDCLSFKDKQNGYIDTAFEDQFSNLNLNQNHKCIEKSLRSNSVTNDNKKAQNYDFTTDNFSKAKNDSNSWKKSSKHLTSNFANFNRDSEEKDEFKKEKSINNSTLSLHIAAYENLVETDSSDLDSSEKSGLVIKWKNSKQFFNCSSSNVHNPFEFPRQEKDEEFKTPEVSQYKSSQRVLNPNQLPSGSGDLQRSAAKMHRKRQPGSSNPPATDTLRARLNNSVFKSPVRGPLSSIQPSFSRTQASQSQPSKSLKSGRQTVQQKKGFSFNDSENEMPVDEEDSQSITNQNAYQSSEQEDLLGNDPLVQRNDAEAEADEVDPVAVSSARVRVRTQAAAHGPREDSEGRVAEGYDGPIYKKLKKLGVEVHTNDQNELYFFTGELTHAKLIKLIDSKWDDSDFVQTVMEQLKTELKGNYQSWELFLTPAKDINGTQDTIFRALILSRRFQRPAFLHLLDTLDKVATKNFTAQRLKLGEDIIVQLRYITEVFEADIIYREVFTKSIERWTPVLRDKFIAILPEFFTDSSVHSGTTKKLLNFLKEWSLDGHVSLEVACLNAFKCFDIKSTDAGKAVYDFLIKNLMNFKLENLPLVVDTALAVSKTSEIGVFENLLFHLCKFLDIEELQKKEKASESTGKVDKYISQAFFRITEFMRFNLSRAEKELNKFYLISKIIRVRASKLKKDRRINVQNDDDLDGSNADEDEEDSEEETDSDDDEENPNDPDYEPEKQEASADEIEREFELIDVMLLICFNEASNDSSFVLKELRKQVLLSYDYFQNLKVQFRNILETFPTFGETYLRSILLLARDLVQSPNPQINEFGVIIYKYSFYNPRIDCITVLKGILSHLSEVDSETSVALSTLSEIVEEKPALFQKLMTEMNALIDNLSLLSYENVRKLFYILISLNFFPDTVRATQAQLAQKRDGEKFIKQLHHYLTSSVFREIVWGVIGLIQYVKVILLKDRNGDNNERISNILKKIKEAVSTVGRGKVRAEFYIQLSELLKPMKVLGECEALITFGNELKDIVEKEIYNQKGSRLPHGASPCTYDSETYIDVSVNTWINLAGFVIKDNNELTDNICWLLPLIQLVKDFASYQFSFADESDPLKAQFWESFKFILEANVDLNAVSRLSDSTATNDKIRHCHVLYTVIEYVRTVLNMFADCIYEKEKVHLWMTKKLKLMILCQSHLNQKIGNLGTYTLPRITQINKDQLLVKGKKDAKKKKPKKDKQKITVAAAPVDESMEVDESRDESGIDNSESNASQSNASGLAHKFHAFKLRKEETLKKIALEQFQWYCTPLRLETVTTLLKLTSRKHRLFLVETLHVILKHTMPIRGKQMPVGFSNGGGAPIPIATMDFGTKEHRWGLVSDVIPSLIDLLSRSVLHFQKGATQTDPNEDFSALLKFCVMIFSRIFQSREIAVECDHHDSNITTDLLTRRQKVVSAFNREINVFNSSIVPQGDITHNPFTTSSVMDPDENDDSPILYSETYLQGRISENGRESLENNTNEANVIAFFIKTAKYVSTIECASAVLSLLKTFDNMDEHHRRLCAGTALHYLNKDWSDESEETSEALEERNALLIATDYIHFRPNIEKLTAINWLIRNQLLLLYPNEIIREYGFAVGTYKDSEEAVKEYEGKKFSCVDKIPQWHKLLFKQFNDNVFLHLKLPAKAKIDSRIHNSGFLKNWKTIIETFSALVSAFDNPGFRVHNVLYTLIKEGKRFISFILSKQSSFSSFIKSKEVMAEKYERIVEILKTLQSANKILFDLQAYVKAKRNLTLLKLIPDLKAAQEKMAREFFAASAEGGFYKAIEFGFSNAKKFSEEKTEKKTKKPKGEKSAKTKKPNSDKPAPKKSKAAENGGGKKRASKNTDEPANKRAKKSKNTVDVIATNQDASYMSFAGLGLGGIGIDSTRNTSGYIDPSDDDASRMSED